MSSRLKVFVKGLVHQHVYPLFPDPMVKCVIVCSARSGSNLLVSLLASHPEIYQYGEVIGDSQLRYDPIQRVVQRCGAVRYLRNCFKKRFFKSAVGVKILYYQFRQYYGDKWQIHDIASVLDEIRNDTSIKIIHLKRRNILNILVSNEIAKRTREYVSREPGKTGSHVSITLSPEECARYFELLDGTQKEFDGYFDHHETFELYYRDLVSDKTRVMQELLDFIGVQQHPLRESTFKQSRKPLSERIENYQQLKQHFSDTRWNVFFED